MLLPKLAIVLLGQGSDDTEPLPDDVVVSTGFFPGDTAEVSTTLGWAPLSENRLGVIE